jgi:hypothetical protein
VGSPSPERLSDIYRNWQRERDLNPTSGLWHQRCWRLYRRLIIKAGGRLRGIHE